MGKSSNYVCNICGGEEFTTGPSGRLSITGVNPSCNSCGSLERHRSLRNGLEKLATHFRFEQMSALQISPDLSVDPSWFQTHEVSIYGGENSLDIQKIDRPNESYDAIICNHVLEHVQYDNAAMVEFWRVLKPDGIVVLTVPSPIDHEMTNDWGYPDYRIHGHFRLYGADFQKMLKKYLSMTTVGYFEVNDEVTNSRDWVFVYTKDSTRFDKLANRFTELIAI